MDERTDRQLIQLNKRYQDLYHKLEYGKKTKILQYLNLVKKGDIQGVIDNLRYRNYFKKHFSTLGNVADSNNKTIDISGMKIAVYSCIVGRYDKVIEPVTLEENVDYVLFTDQEVSKDSSWQIVDVRQFEEYEKYSPVLLNRCLKMFPYLYLKGYDYSIYIDGNIELVAKMTPMIEEMGDAVLGLHYHSARDCVYDEAVSVLHFKRAAASVVKEQMEYYSEEVFPKHFGLFENSVLIRNHNTSDIRRLMETWWNEYLKYPTRDQLSLPYVVWKCNMRDRIHIIGNDISRNGRFNRISGHSFQ